MSMLYQFTPTETLMIISPMGCSGKNLLRYSLLDLVYRGVLTVYQDWRLPNPRDSRERLYTFVARGKGFNDYQAKPYQDPFIEYFVDGDFEYKVRSLAKAVYLKFNPLSKYKRAKVYDYIKSIGLFNSSMGLKYLNIFLLNKKGKNIQRELTLQLENAEKLLPKLVDNNPGEACSLLQKIGANVLLLDCFNNKMIEKLKLVLDDVDFNYSMGKSEPFEMLDGIFFYSFLEIMDNLDTSYDSFIDSINVNSFDSGIGGFDGGFDGDDF